MTTVFVDTDVIVRLLTGDDLRKQARAVALFQQVEAGEITLDAPDTVIADAVFVLRSARLYGLPRRQVSDLLTAVVRIPGFRVRNRPTVLRALEMYGAINVDFGDAMIVASMEHDGATTVYSYDHDFDRFAGLMRAEP